MPVPTVNHTGEHMHHVPSHTGGRAPADQEEHDRARARLVEPSVRQMRDYNDEVRMSGFELAVLTVVDNFT